MKELRQWFNLDFYQSLATLLKQESPQHKFDQKRFIQDAKYQLDTLALKQRMTRTVTLTHQYFPGNYRQQVNRLKKIIGHLNPTFTRMFIPQFVSTHGLDDFDFSMNALKFFTPYGSSELAVRVFLNADFPRAMTYIQKWAVHKNQHVRRLASEGTRPKLPWSFHLKNLIKDPRPTRQILTLLNADEHLYVRKSVANHLNDITKDHPQTVLDWLSNWDVDHPHTAWIIKRALRTLIKQGHPQSLGLLGFTAQPKIKVIDLRLEKPIISLGQYQTLSFNIKSQANTSQKLAIDYKVYYMKKNGQHQPKVFKLKELILQPNQTLSLQKRQLFIDRSTRKHYPGKHQYQLIINGQNQGQIDFQLCK